MDSDTQESLIAAFNDKELQEVMEELFIDDTVDIIEEMPANVVKRMIRQADPETRRLINEILNYPSDSGREHHDNRICRSSQGHDGIGSI